MKIRMDFVTNSRSLSISTSSVDGDGETFIVEPEADYRVDHINTFSDIILSAANEDIQRVRFWISQLLGYNSSEQKHLFLEEQKDLFADAHKVTSGKLTLQSYTFGEYYFQADPLALLQRYSVFPIIRDLNDQQEEVILREMREDSRYSIYSDSTLRSLVEMALSGEHGRETKIVQVLTDNHTLETRIETGEGLIPTEDIFSHYKGRSDDVHGKDFNRRMKKYKLDGIDFRERAKKLAIEFSKAVETVPKNHDDSISDGTDFAHTMEADHLPELEFKGKRFCFIGFDYGLESRERIVKKLGGESVGLTDDKIDYFVIKRVYLLENDAIYDLENDAIYDFRITQFDDEYDVFSECLRRKMDNPSIRILTRDTFDACTEKPLRELKQEEQHQRDEAKRQREETRRQRAEERLRQAQEAHEQREAERRKKYEAKQQAEAEKRRQQAEKAQARAEQQRLVEETKAQKEQARQEAAANAVILYSPGKEPENLRKRLNTLFEKLDGAYPDKKISHLNQDHKKWGETVTEFYRLLGYPDGQAFLEAYGYTVVQNAGGRPSSIDPVAIMEELHRRYANGKAESMAALQADNPDIPWKSLANKAKEYFGNTLVRHLKLEGIL